MREHSEGAGRTPVNPEARWIRLQEFGLSLLLAIPASLLITAVIVGWTVRGHAAMLTLNWFVFSALILGSAGVTCLKYGHEKRVELRDQEDRRAGRIPQMGHRTIKSPRKSGTVKRSTIRKVVRTAPPKRSNCPKCP